MEDSVIDLIYKCLGISELVLLYASDLTSFENREKINNIINDKMEKYNIFSDNNIIEQELSSIMNRIETQRFIFKTSTNTTDIFDFFFNYLILENYEDILLDELIIARYYPLFINKEIDNINKRLLNDDINSKKTLLKAKKVLESYLYYEYEDIYHYIYSNNSFYYRNMSKIDQFVFDETNLMNKQINKLISLFDNNDLVNYEDDLIYKHLNIKEGKVLKFKNKK